MTPFFYSNRIHYLATRVFEAMGPVVLSAFSILITFCLLQPVALWLDPTFSLLASRSTGKIAFTILVLLHIMLLLTTTPRRFVQGFFQTNVHFLTTLSWLKPFFGCFALFFVLHALLLGGLIPLGIATLHPEACALIPSKAFSLLMGFVATFFLAWTEEMIFRGTLFPFLRLRLSPLVSMFATSVIFSLAHDLTNPLTLVTTQWQLGLGLFLLGFFLNLLLYLSKTLYIGMGAHAGLVFVKVVLRRIPLISYATALPWWFDIDLRMSLATHLLFTLVIAILMIIYRKRIFSSS